jgi:hypothetical protein
MKLKVEARKLQALYEQIPSFKCKPGCSDCCGTVLISRLEKQRAPLLAGGLQRTIDQLEAGTLTGGCLHCPYSGPSGCAVYDDRPFLCRLFGTIPQMPCPHGCGPEKLLTSWQGDKLRTQYRQIVWATNPSAE